MQSISAANREASQPVARGGQGERPWQSDPGRSHNDKSPADAQVPFPAQELSHPALRPPSHRCPSYGAANALVLGTEAQVSKSRLIPDPFCWEERGPGHAAVQVLEAAAK